MGFIRNFRWHRRHRPSETDRQPPGAQHQGFHVLGATAVGESAAVRRQVDPADRFERILRHGTEQIVDVCDQSAAVCNSLRISHHVRYNHCMSFRPRPYH